MPTTPPCATGFLAEPQLGRPRASPARGLPEALSELAVRPDELAALPLAPRSVLVCENEITYLSVPVPDGGAVLWGRGFDVDQMGRLLWLRGADVVSRPMPDEADLYGVLVSDQLGDRVRLEQERIDWEWATIFLCGAS